MEIWKRSLDFIKYAITHDNLDWITVIVGDVGIGKSTLAWQTGKYTYSKFDSDSVASDIDQFRHMVNTEALKRVRGVALMIDEGQWGAYSREAMTKSNRGLNKMLMTIRGLNFHIIMIIPDFFSLDAYIRKFRVGTLLRVKAESAPDFMKAMQEGRNLISRGKFEVYDRSRIKKIWKDKERQWEHFPSPAYVDYFPPNDPDDPEWQRYGRKKDAFMMKAGASYGLGEVEEKA